MLRVMRLPEGVRSAHTLTRFQAILGVSHPRLGTETRQIQMIAGQTQEIRFRLAPRAPRSPGRLSRRPGGQWTRASKPSRRSSASDRGAHQ